MTKSTFPSMGRLAPILVATGLGLSACGGGEPFLDYYPVRDTNIVPMTGTRTNAAVCFSGDDPKTPEIRALAAAHCAAIGQVAKYSATTKFACTPTTPNVAYYACTPAPLQSPRTVAKIQPGRIAIPAPAWLPDSTAPPPPTPPSSLSRAAPWEPNDPSPKAAKTEAAKTEKDGGAKTQAPTTPSWDEGTVGAQGAFPSNALTNLPRL